MKLVSIIGARPQIIKAAAVSRAVVEHNRKHAGRAIVETIVHTGQHYDENMSQVFFEELDVPKPAYNLGVGSRSHAQQTGQMLGKIEAALTREKPDWCLVYGDTNSTLAGALTAAKLHIPVAHVEAGLRSFNRRMPEEINRVLSDHISDLLFCPTQTSVDNLTKEGISTGVHQVGDVMYDCVLFYEKKTKSIEARMLEKSGVRSKSYYLATVHRAENTDDSARLTNIFEAFNCIATESCPVVLPLHPRTVKYAQKHGLELTGFVRVMQPISYLEMLVLESNARLILTDSGGVQKEAYWFGVPCVTLRDETEWIETVKSRWNVLAGADGPSIVHSVRCLRRPQTVTSESAYGNGDAASQICNILHSS